MSAPTPASGQGRIKSLFSETRPNRPKIQRTYSSIKAKNVSADPRVDAKVTESGKVALKASGDDFKRQTLQETPLNHSGKQLGKNSDQSISDALLGLTDERFLHWVEVRKGQEQEVTKSVRNEVRRRKRWMRKEWVRAKDAFAAIMKRLND